MEINCLVDLFQPFGGVEGEKTMKNPLPDSNLPTSYTDSWSMMGDSGPWQNLYDTVQYCAAYK